MKINSISEISESLKRCKTHVIRIAWVSLIVSALMVLHHHRKLTQSQSSYNELTTSLEGLNAEVDFITDSRAKWPLYIKAFVDGATLGRFAEDGIFTEYNKFKNWGADVVKREAEIIANINRNIEIYHHSRKRRSQFLYLGTFSALLLILSKRHKKQLESHPDENPLKE